MKILNEKKEKIVNMECVFDEEERCHLLEYSRKNMTVVELERLQIEWAFVKILTDSIDNGYWETLKRDQILDDLEYKDIPEKDKIIKYHEPKKKRERIFR